MSVAKGFAALALAAAGVVGLSAPNAGAAPFLQISLLGSTSSAGPFTSSLNVTAGQTIFYRVDVKLLANDGTTNAFPTAPGNKTTVDWRPSVDNAPGTTGMNGVLFSLTQPTTGIQASATTQVKLGQTVPNFDALSTPDPTEPTESWANGTGFSRGTRTDRGNGNFDLDHIQLFRGSGNFDGVGSDESKYDMLVAKGQMLVTSNAPTGVINVDTTGFLPTDTIASYRWYTVQGTNPNDPIVNYTQTKSEQTSSATGGDPIIVYQPLTLTGTPEPTTLGLLGIGALGLMARRRRA